ncbi:MAG: DUF554 domain-containing protein [Oscillospiraceae bacterium]|nr:DUF554 domain-containing protein [Oscillospiraceae bacterium]
MPILAIAFNAMMLGTLINSGAIALGTGIGLLLKKGIPERMGKTIMQGNGLAVMVIGLAGCLQEVFTLNNGKLETQNLLLLVFSLFIGGVIGELINIEKRLDSIGAKLKKRIPIGTGGEGFVQGFVEASLIYCVGAMAIMGSLSDGLRGDISILLIKSLLDGSTAIIFASTLGIGVGFSILPVLVYQGTITLLAGVVAPYLAPELISQISMVGSALIFAIGINLIRDKKIAVGNLLPAVLVPVGYYFIQFVMRN